MESFGILDLSQLSYSWDRAEAALELADAESLNQLVSVRADLAHDDQNITVLYTVSRLSHKDYEAYQNNGGVWGYVEPHEVKGW